MTTYHIELDENEMLLLSASTCLAAIVSKTPAVFDTIQLDTHHPQYMASKYAEAVLTLLDNESAFLSVVEKLGDMVRE